jgi:hypothetical protein
MLLLAGLGPAYAADANVRVMVVGDIKPGVYGRVDLRGAAPPPLLHAEPMIIVKQVRAEPLPAIYLHVPPAHAKDWAKHCRNYSACNAPVFFVKSAEYETEKPKADKKQEK